MVDVAHDRDHRAPRGWSAEVSAWAETPTTLTSLPNSAATSSRTSASRGSSDARGGLAEVRDDRLDAGGWDAEQARELGDGGSHGGVDHARGGRGCGSRSGGRGSRSRIATAIRVRTLTGTDPAAGSVVATRLGDVGGTLGAGFGSRAGRRSARRSGTGFRGGARARVRDVVVVLLHKSGEALGRALRRAGLALEGLLAPARRGVVASAAAALAPSASVPVAFARKDGGARRDEAARRRHVKREGRKPSRDGATERDVGGGERARGETRRGRRRCGRLCRERPTQRRDRRATHRAVLAPRASRECGAAVIDVRHVRFIVDPPMRSSSAR